MTQQRIASMDEAIEDYKKDKPVVSVALPIDPEGFYIDVSHCEGVDTPPAAEIAALWRKAAENGSPTALTNYAVGNAFGLNNLLDSLDEIEIYKKQAPRLIAKAIDAGDGGALLSLAAAYSPDNQIGARGFLPQVFEADLQSALTLYKAASIAQKSATPDPELSKFISGRIDYLSKHASASQNLNSDAGAAKIISKTPVFKFPPSRDIAYLRRGRTNTPLVSACSE